MPATMPTSTAVPGQLTGAAQSGQGATPAASITPVNTSSFTPAQLAAFNAANALGSGVNTYSTPTAPTISTINSSNLNSGQSPINVNPNVAGSVGQTDTAGTAALITNNNSTLNPVTTSTDPNAILASLQAAFPTPPVEGAPPVADPTAKNAADQALLDAQGALTATNNQINALNYQNTIANEQTSQRQAPMFAITGEQNAQNIANNVKLAPLQLQALTQQAAVASAQGADSLAAGMLSQAQSQLDAIYKTQNDNATAQYNYQTNLIDKAITQATSNQAAQLADLKTQIAQNHSDLTNSLNNAQSVASTAVANGNGAIAAAIAAIPLPNVNSPTFAADLQQYNSAVGKLQATIAPKATATDTAQAAINAASSQLVAARGSDGYTDPNLYARLRASSSMSPTEFDNRFAYLVNPLSYSKLGITGTNAGTGVSNFTTAQQQSLIGAGIPSGQLSVIEQYVNQYGLQAALDNSDMTDTQKTALKTVYGVTN